MKDIRIPCAIFLRSTVSNDSGLHSLREKDSIIQREDYLTIPMLFSQELMLAALTRPLVSPSPSRCEALGVSSTIRASVSSRYVDAYVQNGMTILPMKS